MEEKNIEKIFEFLKVSGNLKNTYRYGDKEFEKYNIPWREKYNNY